MENMLLIKFGQKRGVTNCAVAQIALLVLVKYFHTTQNAKEYHILNVYDVLIQKH